MCIRDSCERCAWEGEPAQMRVFEVCPRCRDTSNLVYTILPGPALALYEAPMDMASLEIPDAITLCSSGMLDRGMRSQLEPRSPTEFVEQCFTLSRQLAHARSMNACLPPMTLVRIEDIWKPEQTQICLLYTSPSPRDLSTSRMPSSA